MTPVTPKYIIASPSRLSKEFTLGKLPWRISRFIHDLHIDIDQIYEPRHISDIKQRHLSFYCSESCSCPSHDNYNHIYAIFRPGKYPGKTLENVTLHVSIMILEQFLANFPRQTRMWLWSAFSLNPKANLFRNTIKLIFDVSSLLSSYNVLYLILVHILNTNRIHKTVWRIFLERIWPPQMSVKLRMRQVRRRHLRDLKREWCKPVWNQSSCKMSAIKYM